MNAQNSASEIKIWLKTILKKESVNDFSVKILGDSDKGDGYIGDIVFVEAETNLSNGTTKPVNLVLKCSKKSQILRETFPVKETFLNEIYLYDKIFPTFLKFQQERGIGKPFDSIPKYYGNFKNDIMEVIVLENLKKSDYVLWNKKKPLTRKHIDIVVQEYGKYHAISVALREQKPEIYKELVSGLFPSLKKFVMETDFVKTLETKIEQAIEFLKNEIDENVLLKWQCFKQEINCIFKELIYEEKGLKVITHGDCWNNNFMFKHKDNNENSPIKVALLDWQISMNASPIIDLSYFLFACISKVDIEDLDNILQNYYNTFSANLHRLGNDADILYPYDQFLAEWKRYCKFGLSIVVLIFFACSSDMEEVIDISETANKGQDFSKSFEYELKDNTVFKDRMSCIMNYAVNHNLI